MTTTHTPRNVRTVVISTRIGASRRAGPWRSQWMRVRVPSSTRDVGSTA